MPNRWKKRLLWLVCAAAAAMLLVLVFLVFERVRGKISLARFERALTASGERLDPAAFKNPDPGEQNGVPILLKAIGELKKGQVVPDKYPPRMRLMPSGNAIVGFREPFWIEEKQTNRWEQVAIDLAANDATLELIRNALAMPVLDTGVDLAVGASGLRFEHLSKTKEVTRWLGPAAQLALRKGNFSDATRELIALFGLSRVLEQDRTVIGELVRIALFAIAKTAAWEALQTDGWSDEDLARVQAACERQTFATNIVEALRGELVLQHATFEQMRRSHTNTVAMLFGMEEFMGIDFADRPAWEQVVRSMPQGEQLAEFLKKQVYARVWRFAWLDQHERYCLERMHKLVRTAQKAVAGKSLAAANSALDLPAEPNRNVYNRLRHPDPSPEASLSRSLNRALMAETDRSLALCAIALKRYAARHGKLPVSLEEIVPAFVSAVPIDYMDGRPVRYRRDGEHDFTLYSSGENGVDDGGSTNLAAGAASPRLLWNREDYIWPKVASANEIQAFRAEAAGEKAGDRRAERAPKTVNVLVINFDPVLHTRTNLKLHEYFRWSDPWKLTEKMIEDARVTSHGFVNYRVVEKIEHDGFTQFRNGFRYTEQSFLDMWEKDRSKADKSMTSFAWLFKEFDLERRIRELDLSEIWLWGAPYMAWDELHWKTPGDKVPYQTENPWFYRPYDIPDVGRTIWIMGWNYERGEGEMLESYCHRIESVLSLTVGKGVWDPKTVTNNSWNQFSRVDKDWPGAAEVGTVHYAPNSSSDYDWNNTNLVWTFADDWLTYPNLPRRKKLLNAQTGGWAGITGHHLWWMTRIPHAEGTTDGFFNNWWEYIVNYDEAIKRLPPPGATFEKARHAMYADER